MPSYLLIDDGGRNEIEADSDEHARTQAQDIMRDAAADYFACEDNVQGTIWLECDVVRKPTAEEGTEEWDEQYNSGFVCSLALDVDPPEPPCPAGEHDWQAPYAILGGLRENPGVWGHGGGVIILEACVRCGAGRKHDTWAQNPSTGEQGLVAASYEPPGTYPEAVRGYATRKALDETGHLGLALNPLDFAEEHTAEQVERILERISELLGVSVRDAASVATDRGLYAAPGALLGPDVEREIQDAWDDAILQL